MFGFLHALGRGVGGKGGETAALEGLAVGGPVVQGAGGSDLLGGLRQSSFSFWLRFATTGRPWRGFLMIHPTRFWC